ncbi:MAG: HAMP domain-containing histidine kinase [Bacteroidia bacterium]|nr:HAMP domain-containing histidine kinase [Bacteroidia bacterium]
MMSVSLLGLIFLQTYWITHDFEIKSQQFDRTVMLALNDIVDQVEENENLRIVVNNFITSEDSSVTHDMVDDSLMTVLSDIATAPPMPPPPPPRPPDPESEIMRIETEISNRIFDFRQRARNRKPTEESMYFNVDSSIDIRIEKDIEQKEVYAFKFDQSSSMMDSIEQLTQQRMQSRLKKLNSMMQKLTFQIVDPSGNIFNRISKESLDSIIRRELFNRGLNLNFSYGVYKEKGKEWLHLSENADSVMLKYSDYKLMLFPNDVFKRNEMLSISFSDKLNYLLDGIWVVLLFSIAFTVLIIWGFAYTLKVVLRQKKLADIKNDFINNMTHEFKTPIATIAIANESMRDPRIYQVPEKLEFYNNIIRDENQRMLRQVETVLQMAQIDKGEVKLKMEDTDINDLVETAVSSMSLTVEQREGKITVNNEAVQTTILADPTHILNVLINILDNANKYSPESPVITVNVYNQPESVIIEISDKGIGMSKEVLKKIFDTFYRATSGNIHDVKGFGLGLSYVKAILTEHQGTIEVESEPLKGSTFTINLPLKKQNQ